MGPGRSAPSQNSSTGSEYNASGQAVELSCAAQQWWCSHEAEPCRLVVAVQVSSLVQYVSSRDCQLVCFKVKSHCVSGVMCRGNENSEFKNHKKQYVKKKMP